LKGFAQHDTTHVVGSIVVVGNDVTEEFIILREMSIKEGMRITPTDIEFDKNRIYNLRLFTKVAITIVNPNDSLATLLVEVGERWFIFPYIVFGFRNRDFNKMYYGLGFAHTNVRGRNERLSTSFALGYDQWVTTAFQSPSLFTGDMTLRGSATYSNIENLSEEENFYRQKVFSTNWALGWRMDQFSSMDVWGEYAAWTVPAEQSQLMASKTFRDAYFSLGIECWYDNRDLSEYATEGMVFACRLSKIGFGESGMDLFKYSTDVRGFYKFVESLAIGGRLYANMTAGGIVASYQRNYLGYGERVRGYFYKRYEGENVVGGNAEMRIPLVRPQYFTADWIPVQEFSVWRYALYISVFADAGKVWYRAQGFDSRQWISGYGAGINILLPYSYVVRLEYAINEVGKSELIFDLGTSF
jgi:outer membrane protein assembly factor BamA